jgi:hypothetical protein
MCNNHILYIFNQNLCINKVCNINSMIIVSRVLSLFNVGLGVTRFYSSYKEKTYEAGRSLRSTASAIGQPLH